jgi:hypothetical protein
MLSSAFCAGQEKFQNKTGLLKKRAQCEILLSLAKNTCQQNGTQKWTLQKRK